MEEEKKLCLDDRKLTANQQYYLKHKERMKVYYQKNKEQIREKQKEYYLAKHNIQRGPAFVFHGPSRVSFD